jgi:hypothetical protein
MSVKISSMVWDAPELTPSEKLVLLALADHSNDEGMSYPGKASLARKTSLCKRTVDAVVAKLAERGLLDVLVAQGANRHGGISNRYLIKTAKLNPPAAIAPRATTAPATVAAAAIAPATVALHPVQSVPLPPAAIAAESSVNRHSNHQTPLEARLLEAGVSSAQARKLVADYDATRIELQLEVLEFLRAKGKGERAPANRGGWLCKAISEDYSLPRGFRSSAQLAEETRAKAQRAKEREDRAKRKEAEEQAQEEKANVEWEKNQVRIKEYLQSLGEEERQKLEIAALSANSLGRISPRLRQQVIDLYVLDLLPPDEAVATTMHRMLAADGLVDPIPQEDFI